MKYNLIIILVMALITVASAIDESNGGSLKMNKMPYNEGSTLNSTADYVGAIYIDNYFTYLNGRDVSDKIDRIYGECIHDSSTFPKSDYWDQYSYLNDLTIITFWGAACVLVILVILILFH